MKIKPRFFWTPQVEIKSERITKTGEHLQLFISDGTRELKAIAWRWAVYSPLPKIVDIAYKLKENEWQGEKSIQLELVGIRQNL